MVNNNIQGAVSLIGPGLVNKPKGNYGPGEFARCQNIELVDDQLVTRRPLQCDKGSFTTQGQSYIKPFGFVGKDTLYVSSSGKLYESCLLSYNLDAGGAGGFFRLLNSYVDGATNMSTAITSTDPATGLQSKRVVAAFVYNKIYYVITQEITSSGAILIYNIRSSATSFNLAYQSGSPATIVTSPASVSGSSGFSWLFKGYFIYKERLWIVTNSGVYFSKATDPMTWTVPDGGFIKFANANSYCAVPSGDSIFIGTDNSVYSLTYTIDPNTDSYSRMISNQGILDLITIQDNTFGIDSNEFFQITPTSISKIFDLGDIYENIPLSISLREAGDNIIFVSRQKIIDTANGKYDDFILSSLSDEVLVFNTRDNFLSKWLFNGIAGNGVGGTTSDFVIADVKFLKERGVTAYLGVSLSTGRGSVWYMIEDSKLSLDDESSFNPSSFRGMDQSTNVNNGSDIFVPVQVDLEVRDFSPDGNEYRLKKFRNMLWEGVLPEFNFEVDLMFDNSNEVDVTSLFEYDPTILAVDRPPHAYRIGVNQRAYAVSVRFKTTNSDPVLLGEVSKFFFTIRDLRFFWTYLQRTVGTSGGSGDIVAP